MVPLIEKQDASIENPGGKDGPFPSPACSREDIVNAENDEYFERACAMKHTEH